MKPASKEVKWSKFLPLPFSNDVRDRTSRELKRLLNVKQTGWKLIWLCDLNVQQTSWNNEYRYYSEVFYILSNINELTAICIYTCTSVIVQTVCAWATSKKSSVKVVMLPISMCNSRFDSQNDVSCTGPCLCVGIILKSRCYRCLRLLYLSI